MFQLDLISDAFDKLQTILTSQISVWHGGADPVVKPENADEIIKQWTDVHCLDLTPSSTERVDGYPRQVWRNPAGKSVIESYTIPAMTRGTRPIRICCGT